MQAEAPLQAGFSLEDLRAAIGNRLFLTVPEVADLTRVDQRTLRRAIEDGQIVAVRIGNAVRIPTAAFLRMAGLEPTEIDLENSECHGRLPRHSLRNQPAESDS
jgi:excisionase family DNA binding protein